MLYPVANIAYLLILAIFFKFYLRYWDLNLYQSALPSIHVSRYIIVCSGPLFGQPRENRRCESTGKFKKLTGPGSISAKNYASSPGRESTEEYY